jgi:hypothetical protein
MVYADLHVHTTNSDGTLTLAEVPEAARRAGVSVVGVTDHDRIHPDFEGPVMERGGVVLIHGIELRVETADQRLDLLGYGLEPTPELRTEVERLQVDRIERGREIVTCLEQELGVSLGVELDAGVGRPHIARAVAEHPETRYEQAATVFEDLIGDGDQCFVARDVPSFDRGVELLREASALVGLAHPFRYPDPEAALECCATLDSVERYYPYDRPVGGESVADEAALDRVIQRYELLPTGGSDAHGTELGTAGLSREEYEQIAPNLPPMS